MDLARRIAQARHEAGLARPEDLAERIGKSMWTVRQYEAGRISPPVPVLEKIAQATGRPVSWFLAGQGDAQAAQPDPDMAARPRGPRP